ncbi:hypothetical protein STENM223S_01780 [Streptomyces tendae]
MYAIPLGDDGAELRPLETWHAEEFLAHLDRGRDFITEHIPFGSTATDLDSAREVLQRYADRRARDGGFLHGLWLDGTLVGGACSTASSTPPPAPASSAAGWSPPARAAAWSPAAPAC